MVNGGYAASQLAAVDGGGKDGNNAGEDRRVTDNVAAPHRPGVDYKAETMDPAGMT